MHTQLVRQLNLVLTFCLILFSINATADIELEEDDADENNSAETVLKPRNFRAPASLPASSESDWSYGAEGESRFSIGIFGSEDLNVSQNTPSRATQAVTPDFGSTSHSYPVFALRAGYALDLDWSIVAGGSVDLQDGLNDPSLGVLTSLPIGESFSSLLGLSFSFPVSEQSRDQSRLTSVTLSWSPLYQGNRFFVGAYTFFTGSFYASETTGARGAALLPNLVKERTNGGGNLFAGYDLTKAFSASAGLGVSGGYYSDGSMGWRTEATLARAAFNYRGLSASGAFSLAGAASGEAAVPNSPVVTFRLHYIFGENKTLGVLRPETAAYLR